jgi:hypothetical protein
MQDFLDLQGASGAIYRFRLWPEGQPHRPIAGNYVVVHVADDGLKVVFAGTAADLSTVRTSGGRAAQRGERYVFTRLNVARERRAAEHADIIAHHRPPTSTTEDG